MRFSGSDAARFQAYQTRARMSAQLWGRVLMWTLSAWVALTFYLVWRQTGVFFPNLQHAYFGHWVVCGILTSIPVIKTLVVQRSLPIHREWYPIGQLADWLNGPQMYVLPFPTWFVHYGIRTALIPIGAGIGALVWRSRHRSDATHIRGLKLLTPREHNRQLNGGVIRTMFDRHTGIQIGTSIIPRQKEYENFLITGSSGSGKSTIDRHMLHQVRDRAQTAIVLDVDSEFIQEFYDEGRGDIVLNPLDARCPFWTPWLEFREESFTMDAEAMAASLVRGAARTPTEEFFRDSARTLIEAIFEKTTDRRHPGSIADFLALPRPEMHKMLAGTRAYPLVDEHAAEQGTGIISVAANATKGFYHLPRRDQTTRVWSARQWAEKREGWIFLPSTEDARAAIQSLQALWLDALVRWLMAADIGSEQIWIFVDELPAMGYQNQIEQLLTRGRKRGISTVIGFQNVSQLRAIYGRDRTVTLTSAPTTKCILRCDEAETAKWASELLGSREIERTEITMLAGLSNYREGVNLNARRTTEHIVTPAEIQLLKPFHGYLAVAGENRTTITIPERHLEKNFPAFIPRTRRAA
jgi:energy-coupling factor transporter ATP-binding protein EcfA2